MTAPEPTHPADEHTGTVALDLDALHETICDKFTGMAEVRQAADLLVAEVRSLRAKVAAVEALAERWRKGWGYEDDSTLAAQVCGDQIYAALATTGEGQ